MNARLWLAAILAASTPSAARAQQLAITAAPDSARVDPGSVLGFTAKIGEQSNAQAYLLMGCPPKGPCYYSAKPSSVAVAGGHQLLTFKSFTIPSGAKGGDQFCFALRTNAMGNPQLPTVVVATACKTVSTPSISAGAGALAPNTHTTAPLAGPSRRTVSASGSRDAQPLVARADVRPDLVIEFEKVPVAKWTVRNVGGAQSPATSVEFRRLGVEGSKTIYVTALAPGAKQEIAVTPELDMYLVNSTADVDPSGTIVEVDETNNRWASKDNR